jgi:hypothetical protein
MQVGEEEYGEWTYPTTTPFPSNRVDHIISKHPIFVIRNWTTLTIYETTACMYVCMYVCMCHVFHCAKSQHAMTRFGFQSKKHWELDK